MAVLNALRKWLKYISILLWNVQRKAILQNIFWKQIAPMREHKTLNLLLTHSWILSVRRWIDSKFLWSHYRFIIMLSSNRISTFPFSTYFCSKQWWLLFQNLILFLYKVCFINWTPLQWNVPAILRPNSNLNIPVTVHYFYYDFNVLVPPKHFPSAVFSVRLIDRLLRKA